MSKAELVSAILVAREERDHDLESALEWLLSERLGAELLQSSDSESSESPGIVVSSARWSERDKSSIGNSMSGGGAPDASNASHAAGGLAEIADSTPREAIGAGHYPARTDGVRLFLWPVAGGQYPRSMPIAQAPTLQSAPAIGLFYCETLS